MKRTLLALCLGCCLLLTLPLSAHAAEPQEYYLPELGLTLTLPVGYEAVTRETKDSDPKMTFLGWTRQVLIDSGIYFYCWNEDVSLDLSIIMVDSFLTPDFNIYSDDVIMAYGEDMKSQYEQAGYDILESEIHDHHQAKLLKNSYSATMENGKLFGLHFYTAYADKSIAVNMCSYIETMSPAQQREVMGIINSMTFDSQPLSPPAASATTTYTDSMSQATLTLPPNWMETPYATPQKHADARFTLLDEMEKSIIFASVDIGEEMPVYLRGKVNPADFDLGHLTEAKLAEVFGGEVRDIHPVTYGGKEYYQGIIDVTTTVGDISTSDFSTLTMIANNGYLYEFSFCGLEGDPYFEDYKALLASLSFPAPAQVRPASVRRTAADLAARTDGPMTFGTTLILYAFPIILYRYAVALKPVRRKKAVWISIIYGIVVFCVVGSIYSRTDMHPSAAGAVILGAFLNYRIMVGGKAADADDDEDRYAPIQQERHFYGVAETTAPPASPAWPDQPSSPAWPDPPDIAPPSEAADLAPAAYCRRCGHKLLPDSLFCDRCGTRIL